jgi:hypothetical protein
MDVIECLAVLHEENMAMVKRLLRPVDAAVMLDITLTWPKDPGEILTPLSTPTEYNYRVRHAHHSAGRGVAEHGGRATVHHNGGG